MNSANAENHLEHTPRSINSQIENSENSFSETKE